MSISIRKAAGLLLKIIVALIGLLAFAVTGTLVYWKLTSRPIGSPPPGFENRLKYERGHISDYSGFDNIPVDLWFGASDGKYDTTHLRIPSDYFSMIPNYHGEAASINVVWPSLRSIDEEAEIRKGKGLSSVKGSDVFSIILGETRNGFWGTDKNGTAPVTRCEPIVRDERRGVKYCNENRFDGIPGKRWTNYWPIDETFLTPLYKNPPRFGCYYANIPGEHIGMCISNFSINENVHVEITINESLAVKVAANFPKLIDFLVTLEVQP